jgi:hypothetical protein
MSIKNIIKYLLVTVLSFFVLNCSESSPECMSGVGNCFAKVKCQSDSDCSYNESMGANTVCNYRTGFCDIDLCEDTDCGLGKCVHGDINDTREFYCQCDEGAVISDINTCFPACNANIDCEEFSKEHKIWERNKYCKTDVGYCVDYNPKN